MFLQKTSGRIDVICLCTIESADHVCPFGYSKSANADASLFLFEMYVHHSLISGFHLDTLDTTTYVDALFARRPS